MRLQDKVAMITGGASGFGAAGVLTFCREGASVVVADVDVDRGRTLAAAVQDAGGRACFVRTDVTSEDDCRAAAETAVERYGRLDIVWANAGLGTPDLAMADTSVELFRRVMDVNVLGPWLTIREAVPHLRRSDGAAVVITASLGGLKGRPLLSAYQTSKGAAVMMAKSLAVDLAPDIRVNAVCPVAANTPMMETFLARRDGDRDDILATVAGVLPLKRLATPEDVAMAALYLASDEARVVTGQAFAIDAGATA